MRLQFKSLMMGFLLLLFVQGPPWTALATITIQPWKPLFKGVDQTSGLADASEVRLQRVFTIRVDLRDPDVEFFSTPSSGATNSETVGQTTTTFVTTHGVSVGINANFFSPVSTIPNDPRNLSGLAISQGKVVSPAEANRPMVLISSSNTVSFTTMAPSKPAAWWTAVAGSDFVVRQGLNRASTTCTSSFCGPNPRTALGISQDRRYLYMLVIDGRQPGWSEGATLVETGDWLIRFGAYEGLNLDGGGSTAMARLTNGVGVLMNRPSGGVQRVNGNHIGVFAPFKFPPVVSSEPYSRAVMEWDSASFSVTASSPRPMSYQWRFNGENIPSATGPNYVIPWVQGFHEGSYTVVVTNLDGAVTSSPALLTVVSPATRILGRGDSSASQLFPPPQATNIISLSAGRKHSVALRADGRVLAWGDNSFGQCTTSFLPTNCVAVCAGDWHNLALSAEGNVSAWGNNAQKQCAVPARATNLIAIAAGGGHSLALRRDGAIIAWGDNSSGQCNVPDELTNAAAIAAGTAHSLALDKAGRVFAWGSNTNLAGGISFQGTVPQGIANGVGIAAGACHNLVLGEGGNVISWGDNSAGQTNVPAGLPSIAGVAGGGLHSIALAGDGRLYAWGDNSSEQCSFPLTATNFTCIAAGGKHTLALQKEPVLMTKLFGPVVNEGVFSVLATTFLRSTYELQRSPAGVSDWSSVMSRFGNGTLALFSDSVETNGGTFYRIKETGNQALTLKRESRSEEDSVR